MPTNASLWQWVEVRTGRIAVMAEWRDRAAGSFSALQGLLTPLERVARTYPNPAQGGPLKVVHHSDDSIVAVDESDWHNRLMLQEDDIVLHQLDLRLLRSAICSALDGVNIAKTPVDQDARYLQIGNWEPKPAASFPVYLLLCPSRKSLREQVLELLHRCRKPGAILLTPSRVNWTDTAESAARTGNMLLVPLSEVVSFEGDGLVETESWEEYLQAFAQMVKLTLPSNYRNKKPTPMRGTRAANIEKLEKAVEKHLIAARDHAWSLVDRGQEPQLLPKPQQQELAKLIGSNASAVSRCLSDPRAKVLKVLWDTADSLEGVMKYKTRRRR